MVNGGDLYLLKNVFPGFHINGSFNRILCQIWMLLTRFDRDVIDFAVNWAVYYGVAWSRAAHGSGPSRYTVCVAKRGFVPLSVRLSNVALVNRSWLERKAVHSILGTEKQPFFDLRWRHRTRLSPKSAAIPKMWELLRHLRSLLDLAINSAIAESQNPGGTDWLALK